MTEPYRFEEELRGSPPRRIVRAEPGRGPLVAMGCMCLFFLPFIAMALWTLFQSISGTLVAHAGVDIPGRVTGRSIDSSCEDNSYKVAFTYRYGGHDYTNSTNVIGEDYSRMENGEPVTVHALSFAPSVTPKLSNTHDGQDGWGFTLIWNAVTWLVVWGMVSTFTTNRGLIIHGDAVAARIVNKESQTSEGSTTYQLHYEFSPSQAPLTSVKGRQSVTQEQWTSFGIGDRVTVMYDKNQPLVNILYQFSNYRAVGTNYHIQVKRY